MFESLVANLLNRFLGSYIENFDPKQLNIGIWSGDVKLSNLRLKKDSLDRFNLPINVKFGHLGHLILQIPWSNLKGKPVKIIIEDLYLLASPIIAGEFDLEEEKQKEIRIKLEKLDHLSILENANLQNQEISSDINSNESFTESLVTKIVDNLQVTIKNIHIRYEDDSLLTEDPYSVGLTLKELSAVSVDDSWMPSFISITQALTRKLLTLQNLSCYMNTDSDSIYSEDPNALLSAFKQSLSGNITEEELQYILKPVSGRGKISMNKLGATETTPHIKAELLFDEFGIDLDSQQYEDILWTLSKFHWYIKTHRFRKYRPKVPVSEDPKQWFRYTAKSILNEIHEKNYKWSWEYFAKRRDQRKAYISLYKQKLLEKLTDKNDISELEALDLELPFEDIKFYRSLARGELRKENALNKVKQAQIEKQSDPQQQQAGWFSGWWGATPTEESEKSSEKGQLVDENDFQLNDDQKKALYDAIDYNESEISNIIDLPRDAVKVEILTTLSKGGLSIRTKKNEPNLAEIVFEGCKTRIFQRSDSFLANFEMQEFRIEDGTEPTLYKHVVSVKEYGNKDAKDTTSHSQSDPFFRVSFENNPLDGSADSKLLAKLKSMTIFYNPKLIEEIVKFFQPPKVHLDTVGAIMNAAEATVEGLTSQTRIGLQYALEEHKTINVKLDLQAPLIILPLEPDNWKSPVAILDAGHISVVSKLVEKSKIEEFKAKTTYSEEDWKQLNTLMYDTFILNLQDAQFLVGPNIKDTMSQLHFEDAKDRHSSILDKLNIKLHLGISILPDVYNLARIKVGGEVPAIKLHLNDFQYKAIMQIIDKAIPDFGTSEHDDSSVFNAFSTIEEPQIEDLSASKLEESEALDAPSAKKNHLVEAASAQHMFEFNMKVDEVKVSLSRCIDGVTLRAEPFIDLVGDSLSLDFYTTAANLHLDLVLKDINLFDHIERSGIPEFERLVSSNNFVEHNVDRTKELFKLDYTRSKRLVEFNNKEIEVFDQDIKMDIATVKFVITRKSILSILNFVLNTFTDPNAEATPADELKHNDSENDDFAPQKINVDITLDSIIVVLNEDSVKLATLQLSTAEIELLLLPEAMDIKGRLGALSLHDDINQGSPNDSILRKLFSIEGDNLAEFTYKTFDKETNTNTYNSAIELKTGSSKVYFVESSFKRVFNYLSQFQRMKEIYDSTREAAINQANQINDANRIKFDFSITAPTVVFPTLVHHSNVKYDNLTFELGELYASNIFEKNSKTGSIKNVIKAGLRNINMTSEFNFVNELTQSLELVEGFDLSFDIDYWEEYIEDIPSILINGRLPEVNLKLTELQLKYLLNLSGAVSNVFHTSEIDMEDIQEDAENANAVIKHNIEVLEKVTETKSEFSSSNEARTVSNPKHPKLVFNFDIPKFALTVYNNTSGIEAIDDKMLSSFVLSSLKTQFKMTDDTHFESSISVKSFVVEDVRAENDSCFTEIIPSIKGDRDQFIASIISEGNPEKKNVTVMLTVDNPKVILSLDYLFELQGFIDKVFEKPQTISGLVDDISDDSESESSSAEENTNALRIGQSDSSPSTEGISIGFSINVREPSVMLLADPKKANTEAIIFKIEQILITSQNVLSLAADSVGLFLCTMDNFNDHRLRIIDDFSVSFAHDSRGSNETSFLTNIQASVDPLLVRLSLRDIKLALRIFSKASELYSKAQGKGQENEPETISDNFKRRLSQYAPSFTSTLSGTKRKKVLDSNLDSKVLIKGEELNISLGSMRFVLIGDVHELPVLDMNIKPFDIKAINWSTDLSAETHIESFVNIYNYSRSTWEPLIEPWPISVYATKGGESQPAVIVDVVSRQLAEITITSRSVALLSQIFSLVGEDVELKSREEASPYKIVNQTGYDLEIWNDQQESERKNCTTIKNNESTRWAFEDWREIRENLDTNNKRGILGVKLIGSKYEEIRGISATGEGEEIIMMKPPINGVHNRFIFDITLGQDNVKTIWLRSAVTVQNDADVSVAIKIINEVDSPEIEDVIIKPGDVKSLPIDYVYSSVFKVKPAITTKYEWSTEELYWKDLLYGGSAITCNSSDLNDETSYYFQTEASYDQDEPLARIYPHMNLVISAPVKVVNLLPFDMNYRLYDKGSRKDWSGSIKKGATDFIHVASLRSLLLLSVEPKDFGFKKSDFAIINCSKNSEFKRETTMTLKHESGQMLKLMIYYPRKVEGRTGLRIVIYSPYVILNRTGQNVIISEKSNKLGINGNSSLENVTPKMFSFNNTNVRSNRALMKVGDSQWSVPLSFDAIGQSTECKMQVSGKQTEMNVAITTSEGEGIYNLTKVISIVPRFILKNALKESIQIVENGSTEVTTVEPNELIPLYGLRRNLNKSLMTKFSHGCKSWSSPFAIGDVGQIFLKVFKENVGQMLLKVNILTENGTIFIQIEDAQNNWPFAIRNFSESEFIVYQGNPNVNENGEIVKTDVDYKPIYYRVPPRSIMPYAYDYPKAVIKELILRSHGRERPINLSEIGNLKPFRLPPTQTEDQKIVDLNVIADGPTQSLVISNYDPSLSMYKLQRNQTSSSSVNGSQQNFEANQEDENYNTRIITRFEGFGISLINTKYNELLYMTLRGLEIRYNDSDYYQNLSVKLKWIQIDNQLYGGIFPIVIYPTMIPKSGKEMNNHPSFSASVCKVKDDSHGVIFIKYATILLQEMSIEIDEDFLFALLDFAKIPGASWNKALEDKLCDDTIELPEPKLLSESSDFYFEALHLQPTLTNLSFVRTERVNAEDKVSNSSNTLMFFFNVLTMAIGNVNEAPIKLNALFMENVRVPLPILMESIQTHYGQSFIYQLHKILGSADVLGDPVGLFNNLASGVLDIFYEPYQGFIINDRPQELGIGIAKGGLSFLKKSIFGFSNSVAKFTGSMAKGLSLVTMDERFQERRRLNQRRNKPKHALYGFASGANSFFESVSSGVTGIATAPIEGANSEGALGFFKGFGKGIVGLPTKTAIGIFDLASNVSEGIRSTTTVFDADGLDKVRLPRQIGYDHVIKPYSAREAQGQFWLKSIDGGVYLHENYLAHLVLPGENKTLIVTFKKLILYEINVNKVRWIVSFDQIKSISMESTGIVIGLKKSEGPFIPIPEKSSRAFLYNRIGIAVEDYNKHCQVVL
ncbi:Vacuolar protein sorting-associated protein 13 [Yamadazyma tenuis]|uniref:Vacuolar protein sorting-associated protein n=1 Tax=Candida tenuis (strain ATCC 10573 / BCRC 21748 / CBS 615 / JCM 9827 / NBRC 10315 / NRRL Y-1498 / VKM Y-70) TaxID=590646 RepID=G3B4K5_CANTC|nr:vacuolar sorting [Yamadazyma tenuis ATCC 10573]EGV63967.1 vacuolar sorting [Yamadazyma tenuis ATCC 10573]WEJ96416.1 Vacuolar protein sorting-associated protein 13 [Yamadazyma tenuis]